MRTAASSPFAPSKPVGKFTNFAPAIGGTIGQTKTPTLAAAKPRDPQRNALAGYIPDAGVLRCGATRIPTAAITLAAGQVAWYGLGRFAGADKEVALTGYHAELLPCDVDGEGLGIAGAPTAATWGDVRGLGACVVIGTNLPCALGEWGAGPALALGLDNSLTPGDESSIRQETNRAANILRMLTFPPGKLDDALPWKQRLAGALPMASLKIAVGSTLDIALLVHPRGARPINVAGHEWQGLVSVELIVQSVNEATRFNRA